MIEVDFIPIGEETNTGDAILCRFTDVMGINRVMLIDGGFVDTSDSIVEHIRQYYGTQRIDLMVCTHPDDDHINGLPGVLDQLEVAALLIHRPGDHGLSGDALKSDKIESLITQAQAAGTEVITTAFAGHSFFAGAVVVAGPDANYYQEMLAEQTTAMALTAAVKRALFASAAAIVRALRPRASDPGEGLLTDNGGTTPRNNSSIILDVQVDGVRALFTGDAGARALLRAANLLDAQERTVRIPDFFDIPHHGSRHNLTTEVVDRILGPIVGDTQARTAFVSVGKKADDFPRWEVANAVKRRGYKVIATRGQRICWNQDAPPRPTWGAATPLPWMDPED